MVSINSLQNPNLNKSIPAVGPDALIHSEDGRIIYFGVLSTITDVKRE